MQLIDLSLEKLQSCSKLITKDIYPILDPMISVQSRTGIGETSPRSVKKESNSIIKRLKKYGYK